MKRGIRHSVTGCLLTAASLLGASCSNTRHLTKEENLYVGTRVEIKDNTASRKVRTALRKDLAGAVRPAANSKTFGIARLKLSLYYLSGGDQKNKKGLKKLLGNMAQAPVVQSSVNLDVNSKQMVGLMENRGFFRGSATAHWKVRRRKATAIFEVTSGPQYTINKAEVETGYPLLTADIDSSFDETLLKPGAPYNLNLVKGERDRIDAHLKERGYYYFRPDYVLVKADTSVGNNKVNMLVTLKHDEMPYEAYGPYSINNMYVFANYRLRGRFIDTNIANAKQYDSYKIVDSRNTFKPKALADALIIEKGDRYNLDDQNATLSRLVNMGTFKFVKNRFDPVSDSTLDVYYYLTQYPRKALRMEFGVLSQSDNRTGTRASLSWRHRNAFKGGEGVQLKLRAGVESQMGGTVQQPSLFTYGVEANFSFPRFVVPFAHIQSESRFLPRTLVRLKYGYEVQTSTLGITSLGASYGYDWKQNIRNEHQFFPINFTSVRTDTLGNAEKYYLLYSNLVFNGIIFGPTYEYTYNSQVGPVRKNGFFFDGLIDLSGNLVGLAQKANYETNPQTVLNNTYAQYVKLQPDVRYYYHITERSVLASRLVLGLGLPYGNSRQLPNIKQFWAGGNSDLRGFQSRLVGPGTFNEQVVYGTKNLYQTLGDLKLEANLELRQKLYKMFELGLFVDAGNIWLYNKNPNFPGGEFTPDFYRQLAVDVGAGLRLDLQILLLRLDVGVPVRKPWLTGNNGWVSNPVGVGTGGLLGNNMILNIAIGYPF